MKTRQTVPPFTTATALQKVKAAEDAWNTRDPEKVSLAYSEDTQWRNRSEFLNGRDQVVIRVQRAQCRNHSLVPRFHRRCLEPGGDIHFIPKLP